MTDAQTPMSDTDIAAQIAAHEAAAEALRKLQRVRAPAATPSGPPVTMAVCEAVALSSMSESQIRRDCAANPYDEGGFGIKIGGRWRVEKHRYMDYLAARLRD